MNNAAAKQIETAVMTGDKQYIARTLSVMHRSAPKKIQKEIELIIEKLNIWELFIWSNGCLLSE